MGRAKSSTAAASSLRFPRTGNPWMDAGVVGLHRVLMGAPTYLNAVPGSDRPLARSADFGEVGVQLSHDELVITGPTGQVQSCLEKAYDRLLSCYFNVSSKKQREDKKNYNFYYNTQADKFVTFPKKRPAGAALLLFDKAVRPVGGQEEWGPDPNGPDKEKRKPGILPPNLVHLQERLDAFLAENGLKARPACWPTLGRRERGTAQDEDPGSGKTGDPYCFLTGKPEAGMGEAKQTAFPLFGGSRSFVSGTDESLRIGWQLDFVGKFVPAVAFFFQQNDDLHLFFPQANSLQRVNEMADVLAGMVSLEPNLFRNFELELGGYFQGRSEIALAFLHRVFVKVSQQKAAAAVPEQPLIVAGEGGITLDEEPAVEGSAPAREPEALISAEAVYDAALRGGAVTFAIVSARKKGNVWMARDFWIFQDVVYLARLLERMLQREETSSGRWRIACPPKGFCRALVDFEGKAEAMTLLRDRVCEAILQKRGVLALLERHAFDVNSHADPGKARPIGPLLDFARLYEVERHKGTDMAETYEKMVQTATWLGNNIADGVVAAVQDKERNESRGRALGALFRLRKTRTTADFVNELARLQFRYQVSVPQDVLDGAIFNHDSFEEFRGFCVVAALNRFLWKGRPQTTT